MSFVHLKVRSHYSLQDGLGTVDYWLERAAKLGMPAMAITEQDNLFSAIKFYRKAISHGIKPIIGVDVEVAPFAGHSNSSRLVLLCMHIEGMRNLNRMLTCAWRQGQPPVVARDVLQQHADGLIALSGLDGELAQLCATGADARAAELARWWQDVFGGNFCLAVQRVGHQGEEDWISSAVAIATTCSIPLVAVNDCRFINSDNYEAHEARVCVLSGDTLDNSNRDRRYSTDQYLRSAKEMQQLFADIPEALANTVTIAERCNLEINFDTPHMPRFPDNEGVGQDELLQRQAQQSLNTFLRQHKDLDTVVYQQRLQEELEVILGTGYAGYFLIVADFIHWAREHGIPVGPGRGSGGGSLVAFVTGITKIDPIASDLLFERFLNPERVSLPDFDVDFCMQRRDEVISYVSDRYGSDRVAQIITYGAMNAKAVLRDVTRILGLPHALGDRLAKQVPLDLDMNLDKALKQVATLRQEYQRDEEVRTVIDLAKQLEGSVRHPGRHAGGIVISPEPLTHYMPLYSDGESDGMLTQFDMNDIEATGLVKFDFLGLRTLTVIEHSLRRINATRQQAEQAPLAMEELPLNAPEVYKLLQAGHTSAVFQLESFAMKRLINDLKPSCFDDLVALVALIRPGPLESGMTKDYIERKHGRQKERALHPMLEPVLRSTYGVILYQEQVMEIARVMSGYTLGMADLLRRAMGKKKPEEMQQHEHTFVEGAVKNGIGKPLAQKIFSLMAEFAGYGFNKSHSVAYALISYHTAWLKANYPAIYMAAVLSAEQDNTDRLVELSRELPALGVKLLPPDINSSGGQFTPSDATILYSLGAIRGVGRSVVEAIESERNNGGNFTSLHDLCCRLGSAKCNRRVLEALVQSGAMDSLEQNRATLFANIPAAMAFASQIAANRDQGSADMFGLDSDSEITGTGIELVSARPWSARDRLHSEWQVLGQYLSGHPVQAMRADLADLKLDNLGAKFRDNDTINFVALVRGAFWGKGSKYLDVLVEDEHRRAKLRFGSNEAADNLNIPREREIIHVHARVNMRNNSDDRDELLLSAARLRDLGSMYDKRAMLRLTLCSDGDVINSMPAKVLLQQLQDIIVANRGNSPVVLRWNRDGLTANMRAGSDWRVRIGADLLQQLRDLLGTDAVQVSYNKNTAGATDTVAKTADSAISRGNGARANRYA